MALWGLGILYLVPVLLDQVGNCLVLLILEKSRYRLAFLVSMRIDMLDKKRMGLNCLFLLTDSNGSRPFLIDDDTTTSVRTQTYTDSAVDYVRASRWSRVFGQTSMKLSSLPMTQNGFILWKYVFLFRSNVQYRELFGLEHFRAMRLWSWQRVCVKGRAGWITRRSKEFLGF